MLQLSLLPRFSLPPLLLPLIETRLLVGLIVDICFLFPFIPQDFSIIVLPKLSFLCLIIH